MSWRSPAFSNRVRPSSARPQLSSLSNLSNLEKTIDALRGTEYRQPEPAPAPCGPNSSAYASARSSSRSPNSPTSPAHAADGHSDEIESLRTALAECLERLQLAELRNNEAHSEHAEWWQAEVHRARQESEQARTELEALKRQHEMLQVAS